MLIGDPSLSTWTVEHTLYMLLMRCFTLILTFGKLVRNLETQAIDEEDAYSELLELHDDFAVCLLSASSSG